MSFRTTRTDKCPEGIVFIPGEVPSKKNSKRIIPNKRTGKFLVIGSKVSLDYRANAVIFYRSYKQRWMGVVGDRGGLPMYVGLYFIRGTRRLFDYNNISQSVMDMMVEAQWIGDDNCNVVVPVFLGYEVDPREPGVYITLMGEDYAKSMVEVPYEMFGKVRGYGVE